MQYFIISLKININIILYKKDLKEKRIVFRINPYSKMNHSIYTDKEERIKTLEQKVKELGEELKKETTKWSTVKDVVIWIANYSKDLFVKILPILLEHYSK